MLHSCVPHRALIRNLTGYDGKLVGAVKCHMSDFGAPCRWSTVWHVIWKQLVSPSNEAAALLEVCFEDK